jgi:hypothetical protein
MQNLQRGQAMRHTNAPVTLNSSSKWTLDHIRTCFKLQAHAHGARDACAAPNSTGISASVIKQNSHTRS